MCRTLTRGAREQYAAEQEGLAMRLAAGSVAAACFAAAVGGGWTALAADRPIAGERVVLKRVGSQTRFQFFSTDPNFLFPPVGSPDDPAGGSPGGVLVELFSPSEGSASLFVPPGAGYPGWKVRTQGPDRYRFSNPMAPGGVAPVRTMTLLDGRTLRLLAKTSGLPLAGPLGTLGIRITTGTLRNCALFGAATVRRDVAGRFVGTHASAAALGDCSDVALGATTTTTTTATTTSTTSTTLPPCTSSLYPVCDGACPPGDVCGITISGCRCNSPASPCGDTSPTCNGTCPAGAQCIPLGPGLFHLCGCIPSGSTPCGDPGAPICGGECPTGAVCRPGYDLPVFGGTLGCFCTPPGLCGQGGGDCPNGFACGFIPPGPTPQCAPVYCGGSPSYPTCGGTCVTGAECQPFTAPSFSIQFCLCAVPAPCDTGCGGYSCPGGQVCAVDDTMFSSCGCVTPP
jgi:hypothetical protein